jgi:hypothetical protein
VPRPLAVALAATIVAWVPPVVFAVRWPEYRAARDFISELGAAGAPDASAVNLTFLAAGVLFVAACAAIARASQGRALALSLVSLVGWSYVVAAFVPCDAGCPAEGSATQALHNAAGALGYLGGGIGLLLAAQAASSDRHAPAWLARVAGALAIAGLAGMGAPELADVRGVLQRVVELGVFGWLVVEARALEPAGPRHPDRRHPRA